MKYILIARYNELDGTRSTRETVSFFGIKNGRNIKLIIIVIMILMMLNNNNNSLLTDSKQNYGYNDVAAVCGFAFSKLNSSFFLKLRKLDKKVI